MPKMSIVVPVYYNAENLPRSMTILRKRCWMWRIATSS